LKDADLPWPIADVALRHHERLDGSGYPDGVTEERLGPEVSILAVCDVVEAMSSHRPYRPARATTDVIKELKTGRGTKYNADVVDTMLPMIESGEFRSIWNCRNSNSTAA
jgi:putative two-component system response regulator